MESNTIFEDLPDLAVVKIFTMLPVKTLIRSCKIWYSYKIQYPEFISAHIQHSLSSCNQNAVLLVPNNLMRNKYCSVLLADTGKVVKEYKIPFKTKNGSLRLCGSFNGIVCLNAIETSAFEYVQYRELCLWNPCVCLLCGSFNGECFYARLGWGFTSLRLILELLGLCILWMTGVVRLGNCLQRLRFIAWRGILGGGLKTLVFLYKVFIVGVNVGYNMTYWLNTRMCRDANEDGLLLSFDFKNEVFGKIKLADSVRYCLGVKAKFNLFSVEGKLAVCVLNEVKESNGTCSQPCCIWLMSHKDGEISWNLRFKAVLKEGMWPLSVSRGGTLLMVSLASSEKALVSLNLMSEDL